MVDTIRHLLFILISRSKTHNCWVFVWNLLSKLSFNMHHRTLKILVRISAKNRILESNSARISVFCFLSNVSFWYGYVCWIFMHFLQMFAKLKQLRNCTFSTLFCCNVKWDQVFLLGIELLMHWMDKKKAHQHTLWLKPDLVSVRILSFGIGSGAETYFAETETLICNFLKF